jgi:hypothetical protein
LLTASSRSQARRRLSRVEKSSRNIVIAQDRIKCLLVVSLQGPFRDADGLAGDAWDFVDRGFGRHDESDDIPAQNGYGLAVGGDHSIAAHDAEVRGVILDRLGARRQIGDLDEFNVDARMICLSDRSELPGGPVVTRRFACGDQK